MKRIDRKDYENCLGKMGLQEYEEYSKNLENRVLFLSECLSDILFWLSDINEQYYEDAIYALHLNDEEEEYIRKDIY